MEIIVFYILSIWYVELELVRISIELDYNKINYYLILESIIAEQRIAKLDPDKISFTTSPTPSAGSNFRAEDFNWGSKVARGGAFSKDEFISFAEPLE